MFELIQNADDNQFLEGETPTLALKCSKDGVQLHCNEVGFTEANVNAICSAGQSSKLNREGERGFIGEKGIGFKSVFAVATNVWISSNAYSFRLDGDRELGAITPIWDENFPGPLSPSGTSMYLRLSNPQIIRDIARELAVSGSLILIFLRRLQQIEFDASVLNNGTRSVVLKRGQIRTLNKICCRSVVFDGDSKVEWLTVTHQVLMDKVTGQRTGSQFTEILLALPLDRVLQKTQSVYNFLPIGDYGFKVTSFPYLYMVATVCADWHSLVRHTGGLYLIAESARDRR